MYKYSDETPKVACNMHQRKKGVVVIHVVQTELQVQSTVWMKATVFW